jgi:hypothetical protein
MKYPHIAFTTIIAVGMLATASPVLADGGLECALDPDTEMLVPPNGSGACFTDFGFELFIFEESDGEFVLAQNDGPAANQFGRENPNGKGFFHTSGKDVFVAYCSAATWASEECNFDSLEPFVGFGEVKVNTSLEDFSFTCPLTARIKATGMEDGHGTKVDIVAAVTFVPDGDAGCKATVEKIDATPVVD